VDGKASGVERGHLDARRKAAQVTQHRPYLLTRF
jgi:hypothetical protein